MSTVNKTALYIIGEAYEAKMSCNRIVIDSALLVVNGVSMHLRSGGKNKLSWIKQLLALKTLQTSPKPGNEPIPNPYTTLLTLKVLDVVSHPNSVCTSTAWYIPST